jgi:hypothetical protein
VDGQLPQIPACDIYVYISDPRLGHIIIHQTQSIIDIIFSLPCATLNWGLSRTTKQNKGCCAAFHSHPYFSTLDRAKSTLQQQGRAYLPCRRGHLEGQPPAMPCKPERSPPSSPDDVWYIANPVTTSSAELMHSILHLFFFHLFFPSCSLPMFTKWRVLNSAQRL